MSKPRRLELGQTIRFSYMDDFTDTEVELEGEVVGYAQEVRCRWPEEMGEADEGMYLVTVERPQRTVYHAVHIAEVLEVKEKQHSEDCDCIICQARTEKGGLDFDPSNDDEEFSEHERQVFRDVGITNKEAK